MSKNRPVKGTIEHVKARRRQLACIGVLLGLLTLLLLATAYINLFRTVPLEISKKTTYITGPLKSNGTEVDYFAAWEQDSYPANMATDENGYRLIVQHLGNFSDSEPERFAQVCEKLGLDAASIQPDMTLEDPDDLLRSYAESVDRDKTLIARLWRERRSEKWIPVDTDFELELDVLDTHALLQDRAAKPWTVDDLPMLEPWLAEIGPALDLVEQAVQKPTFYVPMVADAEGKGLCSVRFSEAVAIRHIARALSVRATHRIACGNIDGAIDDIVTCKRLGQHVKREGTLVSMLVGIMIVGIADADGIAGSLEHPPTAEQLRRLVEIGNDQPPTVQFKDTLLFERYLALSLVQAAAHGDTKPLKELPSVDDMPIGLGYDWNVVLRRMNEQCDVVEASGRLLSPITNPMAVISLRSRSERLADNCAEDLVGYWPDARENARRSTCCDRTHRIVLAMLLYECDHGSLPPAHTADADGNPLHSWRVLLLPYLGQQKLYDKIHLDEPWDSRHNRQFHDEAVPFYQCPSAELAPGRTTYSVVVGPDMPFEAAEAKKLSSFGPRSASMILVVERKRDACWMNPTADVLQVHAEQGINAKNGPPAGIGSQHLGGANCGLRSGSVSFLTNTVDKELFIELLRGVSDEAL